MGNLHSPLFLFFKHLTLKIQGIRINLFNRYHVSYVFINILTFFGPKWWHDVKCSITRQSIYLLMPVIPSKALIKFVQITCKAKLNELSVVVACRLPLQVVRRQVKYLSQVVIA